MPHKHLILVIIFVIHALVFGWTYKKKGQVYRLVLVAGFLCLITFYAAKSITTDVGQLVLFRWSGIGIATLGGIMMIINKIVNYERKKGMKESKLPMYIFVSVLSILLCVAIWNAFFVKSMPTIIVKDDIRVVYKQQKEEDVTYQHKFYLTVSSAVFPPKKIQIPEGGVKVYWMKSEDLKAKYPDVKKEDFQVDSMQTTARGGFYAGVLPPREKNTKYYYFLEVTDSNGKSIVLPENALDKKSFYHVSYKQDPNKWGLLVHILLMMVALMFLIHAFYYAFNYVWNKKAADFSRMVSSIFWGTLCYGVSAFPLGMWVEYEKYGTLWTGFPLGWDMTDTKTLFNFLYWLAMIILVKGTILKKDEGKNLVSANTFAWLVILGGVLTMVVRFAIPHGDI